MNTFVLLLHMFNPINGVTDVTVLDYNMTGADCTRELVLMKQLETENRWLSCELDYAEYGE